MKKTMKNIQNLIGSYNVNNNDNNNVNNNIMINNPSNAINNLSVANLNNKNIIFNNQINNHNIIFNNNNINNMIIKIRLLQPEWNNDLSVIKDLKGLLKLFVIKKIVLDSINNFNVFEEMLAENIKKILIVCKNNIYFTGESKHNLEMMIKENDIINILLYSKKVVNLLINTKQINFLINFLDPEKKKSVINYCEKLSKYEDQNELFETQFTIDLKNCMFDYSVTCINILERNNYENYTKMRNECPNMKKKILYHISKIIPGSSIIEDELNYSEKDKYGQGFYLTDNIDFIMLNLYKEENLDDYGKIIPVSSTFSFIASEIFYDETKMKNIHLDNNNYYKNIKVESNGINCALIEKDNINFSLFNNNNKSKKTNTLGKEYVISEEYQIFPLYTLTLKRNETFLIWRDPSLFAPNYYSDFLKQMKDINIQKTNLNIYYEKSIEEALKFLVKRKYDKVILITNVGKDLSGKRFIEIARKILGFDIIALFFSGNKDHYEWIQKFPNCLCTTNAVIYEDFISNYNEQGLIKLKKKVEREYNIKLMPFSNCVSFPNYKREGYYSSLDFTSEYIRHVYIKKKNGKRYLKMDNGKVVSSSEGDPWDITIYNNEITMFSNRFYLDVEENNQENVVGFPFMKRWNFCKENEDYYFKSTVKVKNNILSMIGDEIKVNKDSVGENELFQLIDVLE
jgi:hypothetical protein